MCKDCGHRSPRKDASRRDELGRKECRTCHRWLGLDQFPTAKGTVDGLAGWCKRCRADGQRLRFYGLTRRALNQLLDEQGNACAICGIGFDEDYRIDHDHQCCPSIRTCGQCTRGLLCRHCNTGLGSFKDSPELLTKALAYLAVS